MTSLLLEWAGKGFSKGKKLRELYKVETKTKVKKFHAGRLALPP